MNPNSEIRTQMVVIFEPTRYQLDHGGALLIKTLMPDTLHK